jgi:hypothetical protein
MGSTSVAPDVSNMDADLVGEWGPGGEPNARATVDGAGWGAHAREGGGRAKEEGPDP